ncbi:MAG TPA: FISUMP domain-containing protein [Candidatus Krumholzibacteriaceae bacterium]|nr:FISUMP domain-containing protein [Candidatus Krumholzibacteriaceae bacterium]
MKKHFVIFVILFVVSFIFINCSEDEVTSPDNGDGDPTVNITSPSDGDSFTEGVNITFTGSGEDHEGTALHEDSLIWTSDHDDTIGTGTSFDNNTLSVNTHVITLTGTDSEGKTDSDTITITVTTSPGTVTDIDGNVYQTVTIGTQEWMAENLKVTHYRNGDPIPNVTDDGTWYGLSSGAYCEYDNDGGNVTTYGRLYNGYAVDDSRNIAPEGWHVATDEEWKQLEMYLGMSQSEADDTGLRGTDEGGKLKESGTTHWISPNTGATNESGFTALPGGYRYDYGSFTNMGLYAFFWSSTESNNSFIAWHRYLGYGSAQVGRGDYYKQDGFSVRCVRD